MNRTGFSLAIAGALAIAACSGGTGQQSQEVEAVEEIGLTEVAEVTDVPEITPEVEPPDTVGEGPGELQESAEAETGLPPPICHAGTAWAPGTQAFRDATADWGLEGIGALGIRVSAVDFDHDGWPDLMVRLNGTEGDDFQAGGKRYSWLLRNTGAGKFEDVTQASGIRRLRDDANPRLGRPGEIFAFGDVNNDGFLDAYTGLPSGGASGQTSEVLLNQGDGTFALGPAESAIRYPAPLKESPAGASFLDFDRDGKLDLWVVQYTIDSDPVNAHLYQGDGAGGFVEVTGLHGLNTQPWFSLSSINKGLAHSIGWAAAACDLNNDGWPELMASSYGRAPNLLFQGSGGDNSYKFTNRAVASGYAFDERQDWSDNESARCWCKLHPADVDCEGVPPPQYIACSSDADAFRWDHQYDREPFRLGGNSAATFCADVDNDGWLDLFTSEIVHWDVGSSSDPAELLLNTREADVRFTRPGNDVTGLSRTHAKVDWNEGIMSGTTLDFDNDGWLDLYWGNSDYPGTWGLLYRQDAPGHFQAVPIQDGVDMHRSHGVAVADFNRDGALDLVSGHSFARCDAECYPTQQVRLFEGVLGKEGNYLQLTLKGGPGTNRAAIGARVTAKAGDLTMTREVGGGYGHYGAQDDLTLHFGLGAACQAEITVRWPDAALSVESFTLPAGYRFSKEQGQPPVVAP
jgi:hypothetical protein